MSACLPKDVRALLTESDEVKLVQQECAPQQPLPPLPKKQLHGYLDNRHRADKLAKAQAQPQAAAATASCRPECSDALRSLQSHRCYHHLAQSQMNQPRTEAPLHPHGQNTLTLAALQGVWYGLYHASGIDLIDSRYDAGRRMLVGSKLTGNDFVRAGRTSWELTASGCRVVSSLWRGSFTPRWDSCHLRVVDRDHFTIAMDADDGDEISFVRASLRELMQWDEPAAPTYGFFDAMTRCGIEPEVPSASLASLFEEVLHHTHGTVLLDQVLLVAPLLLVGGWHVRGGARTAAASLVFSVVGAVYLAALIIRLSYLGIL